MSLLSKKELGNVVATIGALMVAAVVYERMYHAWGWRPCVLSAGLVVAFLGNVLHYNAKSEENEAVTVGPHNSVDALPK